MTIEEIYDWDRTEEGQKVYGTKDLRHPLVAEMHGGGGSDGPLGTNKS